MQGCRLLQIANMDNPPLAIDHCGDCRSLSPVGSGYITHENDFGLENHKNNHNAKE
jgi:hypothetical protein